MYVIFSIIGVEKENIKKKCYPLFYVRYVIKKCIVVASNIHNIGVGTFVKKKIIIIKHFFIFYNCGPPVEYPSYKHLATLFVEAEYNATVGILASVMIMLNDCVPLREHKSYGLREREPEEESQPKM